MKEEHARCETCTYDRRSDPVTAASKCLYCGNYALPKTPVSRTGSKNA